MPMFENVPYRNMYIFFMDICLQEEYRIEAKTQPLHENSQNWHFVIILLVSDDVGSQYLPRFYKCISFGLTFRPLVFVVVFFYHKHF